MSFKKNLNTTPKLNFSPLKLNEQRENNFDQYSTFIVDDLL